MRVVTAGDKRDEDQEYERCAHEYLLQILDAAS
jgi:hypothetical protein